MIRARLSTLKEANTHQREKLSRLREKYKALLVMYNEKTEEGKESSDSSSSSEDEDDDGNCSLM